MFHTLALAIGFSVALQTSEPKIKTESSTFRWEVSLASSPLPEPVTSDTPTSSLSAPPPENPVSQSQNINRSTLTSSIKNALPTLNETRENPSTEYSVKSKSIGARVNKRPIQNAPNKPSLPATSLEPNDSNSPQLTHEKFHTMPFTHGQEATLPPPVKRVIDRAEQVMQPSTLEELNVLQRPRTFQPPVRRLETRPDYGWLIDDLRIKLERLKFYPQGARLNKWQGKVVVQMKILEGGHLIDMEIEKSSGFEVLDQTALAIVRRASPLDLAHPLLTSNVMLSVPLTFQLE